MPTVEMLPPANDKAPVALKMIWPVEVLIVPPERVRVFPVVMVMFPPPEEAKLLEEEKELIAFVATMLPVVANAAATLIPLPNTELLVQLENSTFPLPVNELPKLTPLPPPEPPVQVANTTFPLGVNELLKLTPWLVPVLLPVQFENVTMPVVAGVQAAATETPCDPVTVLVLVPEIVIAPEVLLITPAADPAMFTPKPACVLPDAEPVKEMLPFPVVVERVEAPPVRLIPCEAELLGAPVPLRVIEPPPVVLIEPPVSSIPWQKSPAPIPVPVAFAVMVIFLLVPVVEKIPLEAKPFPPMPRPVMDVVAMMFPVVVNAPTTLIPLPPFMPPMQLENTTSVLPV